MKNQVKHFLSKMQDHHEALSKVHRDAAAEHAKLVDKAMADDVHHNLGSLHTVAEGYHKEMAGHCEALSKAIDANDRVALPTVDTSVPTNANSFGGHQFSAAATDELFKRWFDQQPKFTSVAPSDESLRRTSRLVDRDGKDPRDEGLEKSAPKDAVPALSHWFE